ncbi:MAG TPA: hypothetical protein VM581_00940 [Magnetospirillaceae bacterium]|nr:hypothetical protein [Magnetospirillaceae bacterium]
MSKNGDWVISYGPNRPLWEPVRLVDFADERLVALRALQEELQAEAATATMADDRLALHATLEVLFSQTVVNAYAALAETLRLAAHRLPKPEGRRRAVLSIDRRRDLTMTVGQVWVAFTAPNFPLNKSNPEA